MKIVFKILLIIIGVIFIISLFNNNEPTTIKDDSNTYEQSWRSPQGTEYVEIGKLLVKNNIKICGECHVKEVKTDKYVIACSPDGINWQYFVACTKIGNFYRASDEMVSKLTPLR